MTKSKYAVVSGWSSTGLAIKVYEVDLDDDETSDKKVVEFLSPVVGSFFSIRKGALGNIASSNIFDTKRGAIQAAIYMMTNLVENADEIKERSFKPLFDRIFKKGGDDDLRRVIGMANLTKFAEFFDSMHRELDRD